MVLDSDGQDPSSEYSANMQLGLKPLENKLPNKQTNRQTVRKYLMFFYHATTLVFWYFDI